jgi:hypothetical protein
MNIGFVIIAEVKRLMYSHTYVESRAYAANKAESNVFLQAALCVRGECSRNSLLHEL